MMMIPRTNDEHIGIEIECLGVVTREELRTIFRADELLRDKVDVGYDISIRKNTDEQKQHEVRILCTKNNRVEILNRVMEVLNENECEVNDTCSIHVHLDMRNKSDTRVRTVFYNLVKCSELLYNLQENHRRDSEYCQPNRYKTYTGTIRNDNGTHARRRAVNAHSFRRLRTLEIRLHHGTLDAVEVNTFIDLLLKIKSKRKRIQEDVSTVQDLITYVSRDEALSNVLQERMDRYNETG